MGAFDDLIPAAPAPTGAFADLIPSDTPPAAGLAPAAPAVPGMAEQPEVAVDPLVGVFAPVQTPAAVQGGGADPAVVTDLDRAHADFEERSLLDVTGDRLEKGALLLGAGQAGTAAMRSQEALEALDRAAALEAAGAGMQDFADLAAASPFNIGVLMDPEQRARARANFEQRVPGNVTEAQRLLGASEEIERNPVADAYMEVAAAKGALSKEAIAVFMKDPLGVLGQFATESVPQSIPAILGSAAGPGGTAIGSAAAEGGGALFEALQEQGVDLRDRDAIMAAIQDPETRAAMQEFIGTRQGVIGAADTASMGVAGALARRPLTNVASQLVVEPATEAAGEAAAQLATTGEINEAEVAAEALGGAGSGMAQAGATSGAAAVRKLAAPREDGAAIPEADAPAQDAPAAPAAVNAFEDLVPQADSAPEVPQEPQQPVAPQQEAPPAEQPVSAPPSEPEEVVATQPEEPDAEAEVEAEEAPARPASRRTVYTPDNEPVEVDRAVVEADEILTSSDEGYGGVQPRDRSSAASQEQIAAIGNRPIPERLDDSPETDRGSPIIDAAGNVESGNGRTLGLRRAYEQGTADAYRAYVESQFPEAKGMRNPIIIRRRVSDTDAERFAYTSNTAATLAMSAAEEAKAQAALLDQDVLTRYRGGDIMSAGNRDMMRAYLQKLPQAQRGSLLTSEGGISVEGQRRFQNALFYRAYQDEAMLKRLSESTDDDMRNLTGGLLNAAPAMVDLRAAIERGEVRPDTDLAADLSRAIDFIKTMRDRGITLEDARNQIDAFAEPTPAEVDALVDVLYDGGKNRLRSKAAITRFLEAYARRAKEEQADQAELTGMEREPRERQEIIGDAGREAAPAEDAPQQALLERAAPDRGGRGRSGRGDEGRRDGRRRAPADEGDAADLADATGRPKGRLSPKFIDFSYTNRTSTFRGALREAGMDPDAALLEKPEAQIEAMRKAIASKFGVTVEIPKIGFQKTNLAGRKVRGERTGITQREALDQLLDAYWGMEMLAHIMGAPSGFIGLQMDGKPLKLSLERTLPGALGMFSWGSKGRAIHLPGRSNSFAHEWGHALDHWLNQAVRGRNLAAMLTRQMDDVGVQRPLSPKGAVTDAFARVMQALYGDRAQIAAMTIELQAKAAQRGPDGKPTAEAARAEKILTGLRTGKRPPPEILNRYFASAKEFDEKFGAGGYFTDPAEMFARAFEAWVGNTTASISGAPHGFLTKSAWAYSSTSDERLAMTFPKDADAAAFSDAMGDLTVAMQRAMLYGPDAPAAKPDDAMLYHEDRIEKAAHRVGASEQEKRAIRRGLARYRQAFNPAKAAEGARQFKRGVNAFANQMLQPMAAELFGMAARQQSPAARRIVESIAAQVGKMPGAGRQQGQVYEEAVEQETNRFLNKLQDGIEDAIGGKDLTEQETEALTLLLTGQESAANVHPRVVKLANHLRGLLDEVWYYLKRNGIEVGYQPQHLPRIYQHDKVEQDHRGFEADAAKVYGLMWDREIADNDDAESQQADLNQVIRNLRGATVATEDGAREARPALTQDDEDLITRWRDERKRLKDMQRRLAKSASPDDAEAIAKVDAQAETVQELLADVMDMLKDRFTAYLARNWRLRMLTGDLTEFDTMGPESSFTKGRTLPPETDKIMRPWMESNPLDLIAGYVHSATRRAEFAQRFGKGGEKLANQLEAASDAGLSLEDQATIKRNVNLITGRVRHGIPALRWASNWIYFMGTLKLLGRAFYSSLSEPVVAGLRSGDARDGLDAMLRNVSLLVRKGRRQELYDIARATGLITSSMNDTVMMARMGADTMDLSKGMIQMLGNFFHNTLLTPLTMSQRAAAMATAHNVVMRHLHNPDGSFADRELNDLGIPKADREDMRRWLDELGRMPEPADLFMDAERREWHPAGRLWANAVNRFTNETIQNTLKSDRPAGAANPHTAFLYGIMSFIYGFHRNVLGRGVRTIYNDVAEGKGALGKMGAVGRNAAWLAPSLTILLSGHMVSTIIREALFNEETWKEKEEEGELLEWLFGRALGRAGLTGVFDPLVQAATGIRYERDLTTLTAGPHLSSYLADLQKLVGVFTGRNSASTNSSEHTAARAFYMATIQPSLMAALSVAPAGPYTSYLTGLGMHYLSGPEASRNFADMTTGEKGRYEPGDPRPWWEFGVEPEGAKKKKAENRASTW